MDIGSFVEGPLLWIICSVFVIGILVRVAFFFLSIITSNGDRHPSWRNILATFGRSFLPFHSALTKRPIYAALRYVFHICLVVVPIWFSGHIILWEESRFAWSWAALPDAVADWMTLLLLLVAAYFLIRRILVADIRRNSSKSDYVLILITALPFMTGYLLTHGNLDPLPFVGNNMRTIHVLSGEAMLLAAVFLFYRTQLDVEKCTGCAACGFICPTGTLEFNDEGRFRVFAYSHYRCICCGACVHTCPEGAADLRHEIGLGRFFQIAHKQAIRSVELQVCEKCGGMFAPSPQIEKIGQVIADDFIRFCPTCRRNSYAETFRQLAPWPKKIKK